MITSDGRTENILFHPFLTHVSGFGKAKKKKEDKKKLLQHVEKSNPCRTPSLISII